jgi:multidrug efflux system outer membrane protein
MGKVTVVFLLWAAALASVAAAQTPVPSMTFDEAVALAIERNPTVAQAALSISRAEALVQQARAMTFPSVTAAIGLQTLNEEQGFEGGVTQPQNQVTFSGLVTLPILAPARWAAVQQARDQTEIVSNTRDEVRQQVAVVAAGAYLSVIGARRLVDVDLRALETAQAQLDFAQARFEGGIGSRLDQLRAAQEVATIRARLAVTRLAVRRSQEALGVILAEGGPVDAADEPTFDVPGALDESLWMRARSDVRTQAAIIRAAERVVNDSWKDVAPRVDLSFGPQYVTPAGLFFPSGSWRLGVSLTQPVYLGGLQRAVTRERELTFDQSKIVLTDIEIRARAEVRIAQAGVAAYQEALVSARLAAAQANQVLGITTTAFEAGASTNIEVVDAQRSARDLETAAVQVLDALQRARLDLLVAIGRFPR